MTKGSANQLFILTVLLSLFSAVADLGLEITSNMAPMPESARIICSISTYTYLIVRNATNTVLLLFLLALTRTSFLLRKKWVQNDHQFNWWFGDAPERGGLLAPPKGGVESTILAASQGGYFSVLLSL
jgi:hypothetical protein